MTASEVSTSPTNVEADQHVEDLAPAAVEEEKKLAKQAASRLFFVRLPKPVELSSTSELDKQKDALDEKLRKLGDEIQPVMAERSNNSAGLADARETVRELKAQIEDKEFILNPYRQERKSLQQDREAQRRTREEQWQAERKARDEQHRAELNAKQKIRNDFNSQYGHLGVSNDEEIDEKIRALEFQQQHESLTIAEEKAVLKQLKQLNDSREAVRAFSQWLVEDKADRDAKAAEAKRRKAAKDNKPTQEKAVPDPGQDEERREADAQREEMEELKRIVNGLWEDYKMQLDIKNRHQEIENDLRKKIEAHLEIRDGLRKERDEVWAKIQKHRSNVRAAHKPFSDNRNFSSKVRDLVKKGNAEEARQLCAQQSTELMEQYASDSGFRNEYNKLWDAAVSYQRPAATATETHHNAAASVIAEALEAARRSVASRQAQAQARSKETEAKPAEALPKLKGKTEESATQGAAASAAPLVPSKPAVIPGMEEAVKPKPKAKKDKKGPKIPPVELPKVDDTPFVPPIDVAEKNAVALSVAELKEQERVRNRAAEAEAAQRKERRRQAQEKKKQKAQQRAENYQVGKDAAEEIAAPVTPPVEEVAFKAVPNAAPEGLPEAVAEETKKLKVRNGKTGANAKDRKAAPVPKPRPFARKKTLYGTVKAYGRQLYSTAEDYPLVVGVSSVAALVLAVTPVFYFYS